MSFRASQVRFLRINVCSSMWHTRCDPPHSLISLALTLLCAQLQEEGSQLAQVQDSDETEAIGNTELSPLSPSSTPTPIAMEDTATFGIERDVSKHDLRMHTQLCRQATGAALIPPPCSKLSKAHT